MAIPLRPNEKSYRPTHRAAGTRGCIAWDTSYISTIGCQGTESTLESTLKALGFSGEGWTGSKYKRWKKGTRHSEAWMFERLRKEKPIAPAIVLWQVQSKTSEVVGEHEQAHACVEGHTEGTTRTQPKHAKLNRRILIRVHASAFHQLWTEILAIAKMQRPQVLLEDLRFELGSIVVQGPQSTEALGGVLKLTDDQLHMASLWPAISAISNPAILPQNVVLAMSVLDPRLNHPPKQTNVQHDKQTLDKINETIVSWPLDDKPISSALFDHKPRYKISKSLPSQKAINRRRASLLPGQQIEVSEKDLQIPAVLLAHRSPEGGSNTQGAWTVLLPWSCVDFVWRSLMYYPLSTGNTPRFGGLEQTQQVAFEKCIPWFPGDFPGTDSGKAWDRTESENRFDRWLRRPPSKRHAWDTIDLGLGRKGELGRGWACDWEYLFQETAPVVQESKKASKEAKGRALLFSAAKSTQPRLLTQRQRKAAAAQTAKEIEQEDRRRNTSSPDSEDERQEIHNNVKFGQLTPSKMSTLTKVYQSCTPPLEASLVTVRLKLLTKGTPSPAARIYRLPSVQGTTGEQASEARAADQQASEHTTSSLTPVLFTNSSSETNDAAILRQRWLDLDPSPFGEQPNPKSSTSLPIHLGAEKTNRYGDPVNHTVYDSKYTRDLSRIRVFPPRETKPEVLNMFGPRPPPRTEEELRKVLQPQLVPKLTINSEGDLVAEDLWDKHVPCPGSEDLIGYVTSGGYNLVEGRGTAIGAIWIQKVFTGWKVEDHLALTGSKMNGVEMANVNKVLVQRAPPSPSTKGSSKTMNSQAAAKARDRHHQRIERERHLCVVRNSGESIGRLAIWEIC